MTFSSGSSLNAIQEIRKLAANLRNCYDTTPGTHHHCHIGFRATNHYYNAIQDTLARTPVQV